MNKTLVAVLTAAATLTCGAALAQHDDHGHGGGPGGHVGGPPHAGGPAHAGPGGAGRGPHGPPGGGAHAPAAAHVGRGGAGFNRGPGAGGPRAASAARVGVRAGGQFVYRGHPHAVVRGRPFYYPSGWGYRSWRIGQALPFLFLSAPYFYDDYYGLGVPPPPPGFRWVRYGPDLLMVNVRTGYIADAVYGVFY